MTRDRTVSIPARTVLTAVAIIIGVFALLEVLWIVRAALVWAVIALFLALAINPLVDWLQSHGVRRRGIAAALAFLLVLSTLGALGATGIPIVVQQVDNLARALPEYVDDLTHGRGPLGSLEREYEFGERVRRAVEDGGANRVFAVSGTVLTVTKSVVMAVVAAITIAVLAFMMLLEGPRVVEHLYSYVPERSQARWRGVGRDIYRTIGGYVSGNLLISLIAGSSSAIVLAALGVPYALALGLLVALLDLIPLAGATLAAIAITAVAFVHAPTAAIIVFAFFVVYQQVENHVLQPLVYGRTVQLSPLVVLISVLVGAKLAGILGALAAIPVAGTIQVLVVDYVRHRRLSRLHAP